MLRLNRQGVYYVDKDYNGTQSDMPFDYCVISVNFVPYGQNHDVQAQAFAFNITNGSVKYKCVSGIGTDRDYPWKDVPVGLPSFYQSYADLSSLATALGEMSSFNPSSYNSYVTQGTYWLNGDLIEVHADPSGDNRVLQRVTQLSGSGAFICCWARMNVNGIWGDAVRLDMVH